MKSIFFSTILLVFGMTTFAQTQADDIVGKWLIGSGEAQVEIYKNNNKYFGKIIKVNSTEKNAQKALGKEIIKDLEFQDGQWVDGTIFIIKRGKTADCEVELSGNTLTINVSVGMASRSQTWTRL